MPNLEPCRYKMVLFACADNEGPDQCAHHCTISTQPYQAVAIMFMYSTYLIRI